MPALRALGALAGARAGGEADTDDGMGVLTKRTDALPSIGSSVAAQEMSREHPPWHCQPCLLGPLMSTHCSQTWRCLLPGHQQILASMPWLALTPFSRLPFPSLSTYFLLKPQIRCHLLCGVLSDCPLCSGQVSLPSFLNTYSPQASLSLQLGSLLAHVIIYPFPHSCKHRGR